MLVARAALHFWEEPPISGEDGSGIHLLLRLPSALCLCQNASIALGEGGPGNHCRALERRHGRRLGAAGALNINYCVTPTHFAPQIARRLPCSARAGVALPVLWNTGGCETVEAVRGNVGFVDAYLTDFKYADAALAARYSHAADCPGGPRGASDHGKGRWRPCLTRFRGQERLVSGVVVRHLMLPGALDNSRPWCGFCTKRFGAMSGSRS